MTASATETFDRCERPGTVADAPAATCGQVSDCGLERADADVREEQCSLRLAPASACFPLLGRGLDLVEFLRVFGRGQRRRRDRGGTGPEFPSRSGRTFEIQVPKNGTGGSAQRPPHAWRQRPIEVQAAHRDRHCVRRAMMRSAAMLAVARCPRPWPTVRDARQRSGIGGRRAGSAEPGK